MHQSMHAVIQIHANTDDTYDTYIYIQYSHIHAVHADTCICMYIHVYVCVCMYYMYFRGSMRMYLHV